MAKPFDVSKFRKDITKSIDGLSIGFHDPTDWVSTGNYALNYLVSGDFYKGIPMGKVTVFAGESGSGKSYFCSGNIVKHAQEQGIFVVLIDSENALDEDWLQRLDVDTSESKLLKLNMSMIDDVAKALSEFLKEYRTNYGDLEYAEMPKLIFVIDSDRKTIYDENFPKNTLFESQRNYFISKALNYGYKIIDMNEILSKNFIRHSLNYIVKFSNNNHSFIFNFFI